MNILKKYQAVKNGMFLKSLDEKVVKPKVVAKKCYNDVDANNGCSFIAKIYYSIIIIAAISWPPPLISQLLSLKFF